MAVEFLSIVVVPAPAVAVERRRQPSNAGTRMDGLEQGLVFRMSSLPWTS